MPVFFMTVLLSASLLRCGGSKSEDTADKEEDFNKGQPSTVVTGANLTGVSPECTHESEEGSNFQNLSCRLIIKDETVAEETDASDEETANLKLMAGDLNVVTAVEGVEVAWGIPPDLGFNCFRVRQSTEIFCFRESGDEIEDFNILLTVTSLEDRSITIRAITTVVSSTIDQTEPPESPSALSATADSSTQINLSFTDNSETETQFSIERSLNNSTWGQIAVVASNVVSYYNTGLTASTLYYYRVKACNAAGCSEPSAVASDTTDASGSSDQRIFVTSATWTGGNISGVLGAHILCTNVAQSASLSGNWKAVISASGDDAYGSIANWGIVRNMNGDKVADDGPDFWDGSLDLPVKYNESNSTNMTNQVWTGSGALGTESGSACLSWSSNSLMQQGTIGDAAAADSIWIDAGTTVCNFSAHLYCIDGQ